MMRRIGTLLLDRLLPRHKDGKRYLTVGEIMTWGLIWTACLWLNQLLWLHDQGW